LTRIVKGGVVAYFKILTRNLLEGTQENHENLGIANGLAGIGTGLVQPDTVFQVKVTDLSYMGLHVVNKYVYGLV
jgi:hypothetical protein